MSNSTYCDDHYEQPSWMKRMDRLEQRVKKLEEERKKLPMWKKGVPPHKGWWLVRKVLRSGRVVITCESWVDNEWPYEFDYNVSYMDMNELDVLPKED